MRILAIDAALRTTGLALLDGRRSRVATVHFKGGRDEFHRFAEVALANFLDQRKPDVGVGEAVVEWPPRTLKERDGRRVRDMARELGFACGGWVAACRACGIPTVVTVDVSTWREGVLGPEFKGAELAKQGAVWRANDYLARHALASVADDHQAEALCLGLWWDTTVLQRDAVGVERR